MKKNKSRLLLGMALVVCFGCNPMGTEKLKVEFKNPSSFKNIKSQVSSVSIINNQLVVSGSLLSGIKSAKLKNNSQEEVFQVESASDNQLIANGGRAISFIAGSAFDLILSDAYGSATFAVTFALDNGSVTGAKLATMGATNGQVLKYTTLGGWAPASFSSSQTYLATWNATTNVPDITTSIGAYNAGDYYIVSAAGSALGFPCAVGDWVMFNGLTLQWDKIANSSISGTGTANYIPYYSSASALANSPMFILSGKVGIGTLTPATSLDVKGTLNLSGATSGYVGFAPAAVAGSTTYTLPTGPGTSGQVLTTNGVASTPTLSWTSVSVSGGTVTSVASANGDIVVTNGTTTADLAVNTGTGANQIVKLTAASKLPAVDGSLLTSLASANLTGTVAVANGGTGAATLGASQSALGITIAGPLIGNVPTLGVGVIASRLCASDATGGTISCTNSLPTSVIENSVVSKSGTGNLLFGTGPTITSPVVTNIAPAANFTLTQNAVVPFTSENTGALANTLYLKTGSVGIGTASPAGTLHISKDSSNYSTEAVRITGRSLMNVVDGTSDAQGFGLYLSYNVSGNRQFVFADTSTGNGVRFIGNSLDAFNKNTQTRADLNLGTESNGVHVGVPISNTQFSASNASGTASKILAEIKGAASQSANFLNVSSSSGAGDIMTILPSGNVGIGATAPTAKFTVTPTSTTSVVTMTAANAATTFTTSASTTLNVGDYLIPTTTTGQARAVTVGGTTTSFTVSPAFSAAVTGETYTIYPAAMNINNGNLFVQGSTGNVGIGTTNPTYPLHIAGSSLYTSIVIDSLSNKQSNYGFAKNGVYKWQFGMDFAANGTSDWFVYDQTATRARIYIDPTGNINFGAGTANAYGGSPTVLIKSTGNVGIGTANPTMKLDIVDNNTAIGGYRITNTLTGANAQIQNQLVNNVGSLAYFGIASSGYTGFTPLDGGKAFFGSNATDTSIFTQTAKDIIFSTNATEVMRIKSGGNVGIGTATPGYKLDVNGNLNVSGTTTNVSDERFKKNITKIPDALEKLLSLDGVFYNYRTDEFPERNFTNRRVMGVIAQKVEKVFPEAVSKDDKGFRSVAYSMLIAPIIEAIRGLDKRITELFKTSDNQSRAIASMNAKTLKLEAENAELKARLDKIEKLLLKKK